MAAAKTKSATSRVANVFTHPTIVTQRNKHISPASSAGSSPTITKTPKTPADDGIDFFESAIRHGEAPVRVYELPLEPDGGPDKSREVRLGPNPSIVTATLTNLPSTFVSRQRISRIFSAFL
jgi:glycogen debranching enzyme